MQSFNLPPQNLEELCQKMAGVFESYTQKEIAETIALDLTDTADNLTYNFREFGSQLDPSDRAALKQIIRQCTQLSKRLMAP
jgi:hypothetical protein